MSWFAAWLFITTVAACSLSRTLLMAAINYRSNRRHHLNVFVMRRRIMWAWWSKGLLKDLDWKRGLRTFLP